ncbi:glycerol kinase, partial [bacterium]|nr:glycerol kinase [bacterium]
DQGTTSSRAIVFDQFGNIQSIAQKEFTQIFPQPGWVEHDANEIWSTQLGVAAEAIIMAKLTIKDIAAIGITNQRETAVLWDKKSGQPLHNAIVWQCRRTADRCKELAPHREMIQSKTGLVLDAYFSATKIEWILNRLPVGTAVSDLKCGTIDTWVMDRLTGGAVHATDPSNASRTMVFNIHTMAYDDELLALFNVPKSILPEVLSSDAAFGVTSMDIVGASIPITGVVGDQQAALFAQTQGREGEMKVTYGTGLFAMMPTSVPTEQPGNLLSTVGWQVQGKTMYAVEGSVFIGGALIQWLRDGLGIIRTSEAVEPLAVSVGTSEGIVIVPAFVGLGAPYWDSSARGLIIGITRGTTSAHIAYAALEAIACQVDDVVREMMAKTGVEIRFVNVDGGASKNNLLMQIQADILGIPIVRGAFTEVTALGAAMMAGVGNGIWIVDQLGGLVVRETQFLTQLNRDETRLRWERAVDRSRGWINDVGRLTEKLD